MSRDCVTPVLEGLLLPSFVFTTLSLALVVLQVDIVATGDPIALSYFDDNNKPCLDADCCLSLDLSVCVAICQHLYLSG